MPESPQKLTNLCGKIKRNAEELIFSPRFSNFVILYLLYKINFNLCFDNSIFVTFLQESLDRFFAALAVI